MATAFRPTRRLALALGLSLLAHFLIAGHWGNSPDDRIVPGRQVEARLDVSAAPAPVAEVSPPKVLNAPVALVSSREVAIAKGAGLGKQRESAAAPPPRGAGADTYFHSARELDHYPEPLSRQELQGIASAAVRVWVSIDREGVVREVAAADTGPSVDAARERLLSVRFLPARRAGLPVNSRVLIELPGH